MEVPVLKMHRLIGNILQILSVSGYINVSIMLSNAQHLLSKCHRISANAFVSSLFINIQYSLDWLFPWKMGIMRRGIGCRAMP